MEHGLKSETKRKLGDEREAAPQRTAMRSRESQRKTRTPGKEGARVLFRRCFDTPSPTLPPARPRCPPFLSLSLPHFLRCRSLPRSTATKSASQISSTALSRSFARSSSLKTTTRELSPFARSPLCRVARLASIFFLQLSLSKNHHHLLLLAPETRQVRYFVSSKFLGPGMQLICTLPRPWKRRTCLRRLQSSSRAGRDKQRKCLSLGPVP